MQLDELTVKEIRTGLAREKGCWRCLACGAQFAKGEVYPADGHYYGAKQAARAHMAANHPAYLAGLIHDESRYNGLTENQARLLELFAAGYSDKEIADTLDIAVATVRHQKFTFREKAKAAKLYLAVFEGVFNSGGTGMAPVHAHATQVDERYVVTENERRRILDTFFTSQEPLRLKSFSPKEKKKVVILGRIAQEFEPGRSYTELEVNAVLREIFDDIATLRRYLIEYGFMARNRDGSRYTLT